MEIKVLICNCFLYTSCNLDLSYRIMEMCELLTCNESCLFAQILNEAQRLLCGFNMMHLEIIPCSVAALRWRGIVTLSLPVASFVLEDRIFVWLISVNIVYSFVLLEYVYGLLEICLYDLLASNS